MKNNRKNILYICSFISQEINKKYGGRRYSPAGYRKKLGLIQSMRVYRINPVIVSPVNANIFPPKYFGNFTKYFEKLGVIVYYPSVISIIFINELFLVFSTIYTIIKLRKKYKFDSVVFYNYNLYTTLPAFFCKLFYNVPIVIEYEDGLFSSNNLWVAVNARLLERVFGKFINGAIINTSNFIKHIKTKNYCIIRGFVDLDIIEKDFSQYYYKEKEKNIILFAGQFDAVRGIDTFLKVCQGILSKRDNIEFWITGYGKDQYVADVKRKFEQITGNKCRFWGYTKREKYIDLISKADILVNLQKTSNVFSRYSFPSKLIEFMASGNVVVSTKVSDLERFAKDLVVLCEDNPTDIIKKIEEAIDNPEKYKEYGYRAKEWVMANCTQESSGKKLLKILF